MVWFVSGRYPMIFVVGCGDDVTCTTIMVSGGYYGWPNRPAESLGSNNK